MPSSSAIIIVNWNAWQDTIQCIQSCSQLAEFSASIIVVDNGSTDGSMQRLVEWVEGSKTMPSGSDQNHSLMDFPKSIFGFVTKGSEQALNNLIQEQGLQEKGLYIVAGPSNLGFAGGVNVGLSLALADPKVEFCWLLNNDTKVDSQALTSLLSHMNKHPNVGICGSTLLYMDRPQLIQAVGGEFNPWLASSKHCLGHQTYSPALCATFDTSLIDYVVGASMFIRHAVLDRIGFLNEEYFLYCEEIDFATRMKLQMPEMTLGYEPASLVYHKEGVSTGANNHQKRAYRYSSDFFFITSRLKFTHRFYPAKYWVVRSSMLLVAFNRLRRKQWRSMILALCVFLGWVPDFLNPHRQKVLAE